MTEVRRYEHMEVAGMPHLSSCLLRMAANMEVNTGQKVKEDCTGTVCTNCPVNQALLHFMETESYKILAQRRMMSNSSL